MKVSISILLFVSIILPSISSGQPCENSFGGFLDAIDKSLIADANGDGKDDLVLFNTGGSGSALRVIDLTTMNDIKSMSYTTLGGGWHQTGDRALIAKLIDPNNPSLKRDFLVLFNTGYSLSASALRVIDLTTMNDIKSMSYTTLGGGWNEAGDRALIADANGDGNDDLVLFNTDYSLSASALRVIDLKTMNDIKSMSYTALGGGWSEAGDRALIADADGDEKDDLVLFNTDYSLSAIALRVINLTTMNDIKTLSYSAQGGGWNDSNDIALTANVSNDKKVELVLINAGYTGMAIQVKDLTTMTNFSTIMHCKGTPPPPTVVCIDKDPVGLNIPRIKLAVSEVMVTDDKEKLLAGPAEFSYVLEGYFIGNCTGVNQHVANVISINENQSLNYWLLTHINLPELCINSKIAIAFYEADTNNDHRTWKYDTNCSQNFYMITNNELYGTMVINYADFANTETGTYREFNLQYMKVRITRIQ